MRKWTGSLGKCSMRNGEEKAVRFIYTGASFAPLFSVSDGKTIKLDWGDRQSTTVNGAVSNVTYTHDYAEAGTYQFKITGDLDGITKFQYNISALSGDIANLSGLTSLTYLALSNTSVSTYTQGTLPDWDDCNIHIHDLGLSIQAVDDFLCDLNAASSSSIKLLNIHGTNAVPSVTGLACKDNDPNGLVAKGWTVVVST